MKKVIGCGRVVKGAQYTFILHNGILPSVTWGLDDEYEDDDYNESEDIEMWVMGTLY